MSRIRLSSIIILTFLSRTISLRNFALIPKEINCIANVNYVSNKSCTVDKSSLSDPRINIEGQMKKAVVDMRIDYSVELERSNKRSISVFKVRSLDGCTVMYTNITQPMLVMFRDMLLKHGAWPKRCPVPADYHYKFTNVAMDPDYLPTFVPEADFKIVVVLFDRKVQWFHTVVYGKISYKKKKRVNL